MNHDPYQHDGPGPIPQDPQPKAPHASPPGQPLYHVGPVAPQQGVSDTLFSNIQLNYWLSAFIPLVGIIFYFVDKGKSPLADQHLTEILNLAIIRMIVGALVLVPFVGWIIAFLGGIAGLMIGIAGALNGPHAYRAGKFYEYPFNVRLVKS